MLLGKNMANKKIAIYALIISVYTAISLLMGSISFGPIQIRIAEALLVFCLFDKKYIVPITLGCFVTNLLGVIYGLNPIVLDLLIGTLATLLSGVCVYYFRDIKTFNLPLLSLILPAIINGILIGIELAFYFPMNVFVLIAYVGLGELISVSILGCFIYKPIGRIIKQYLE